MTPRRSNRSTEGESAGKSRSFLQSEKSESAARPTFIIAGKLAREYLLPPSGQPLLDSPGGSLLYAAGGLALWESDMGLVARVGRDYPEEWINRFKERGFDTRGIRIQPEDIDLRSFIAYTNKNERSLSNPVSHFARRELTFPKALLGYQPPDVRDDPQEMDPLAPGALDVPEDYRDAPAVHLCPLDFTSQSQLIRVFKSGSNLTLSLDPAPSYMTPKFWRNLRVVLQGVTCFQPSEEELRALFWGETHDLWEMAKQISNYGPQFVIIKRGQNGQYVYDAVAERRYEVPAYPARFADPTGVGDAFAGGFLAGFMKTKDPVEATIHGSVSASLKVEGSGPFYPLGVMPGLAEARLHALREQARRI
jgi:sugar/nucleoside kinase (ribokinase family)